MTQHYETTSQHTTRKRHRHCGQSRATAIGFVTIADSVRGVSMALAERWRIDPEFVETVIEPLREEAKEAQRQSKGRGKKGQKKISDLKCNPQSRTKLAKLHGTNALPSRQLKRAR